MILYFIQKELILGIIGDGRSLPFVELYLHNMVFNYQTNATVFILVKIISRKIKICFEMCFSIHTHIKATNII